MHVDTAPSNALGQVGGMLLTETVHTSGLGHHLKQAVAAQKKPFAIHDPGKIVTDLAIALALGGDALCDSSVLRNEPDPYGPVASNPTITRLIRALADDADQALAAIDTARATARARVWELAGTQAPNHDSDAQSPMIIDIDATLVTAQSEKEQASSTYKNGFGLHPLLAFIDHGSSGCGEPAGQLLRPGNVGSNTAADHIESVKDILAGPPGSSPRPGKRILIRTGTSGGTHAFLSFLTKRRLSYSLGFMLPATMPGLYRQLTKLDAWEPAYDTDGGPREGADVTELTNILDLEDWSAGTRIIVRRERPHPGTQLRLGLMQGLVTLNLACS